MNIGTHPLILLAAALLPSTYEGHHQSRLLATGTHPPACCHCGFMRTGTCPGAAPLQQHPPFQKGFQKVYKVTLQHSLQARALCERVWSVHVCHTWTALGAAGRRRCLRARTVGRLSCSASSIDLPRHASFAMDAPPPPDWAQLPFPLVAQLVRTLAALPPHCGLRQLLEVCRDWRSAVSDALESWTAPPAVLAGSTTAADAPLPLLLRRFRHLRHLTLDFAELAEEGEAPTLGAPALLALSSLRRLECLHLAGCRPSQALFRAVAALPSLRSLAFTPGDGGDALVPRDASPAPLAGATALTSLALASFPLGHVRHQVVVAGGKGRLWSVCWPR